ncbi:MAG: hypothetical protein ACJZ4J_00430, partial [Candidatus Poseidoniales archaeon]
MRRSSHALILTLLMLSSGCLGMLGGDEDSDDGYVDLGLPPVLSISENEPFLHNQNVVIQGDIVDAIDTVHIRGTMANG